MNLWLEIPLFVLTTYFFAFVGSGIDKTDWISFPTFMFMVVIVAGWAARIGWKLLEDMFP